MGCRICPSCSSHPAFHWDFDCICLYFFPNGTVTCSPWSYIYIFCKHLEVCSLKIKSTQTESASWLVQHILGDKQMISLSPRDKHPMNITKGYNLGNFFEPPKLSLPSLRIAFILHQQRSCLFNSLSQEGFNNPLTPAGTSLFAGSKTAFHHLWLRHRGLGPDL